MEVEEEQQAEEDNMVNHVKARLETGQHMEQHPRQQVEPHRRYEKWPPAKRTTRNILTTGTCVSAVGSRSRFGTRVQHAPRSAAGKGTKKGATARITRSMWRKVTWWQ